MRKFLGPFILAAGLAACSASPPEIKASDGWARETSGAAVGAVYMTISNGGGTDDRLIFVKSNRGKASLHRTEMANGVARMRPVPPREGLIIPAGGDLLLSPGGAHVMVADLEAPLRPAEQFDLTLRFQHSRPQRVRIAVRPAAASGHNGHGAAQ